MKYYLFAFIAVAAVSCSKPEAKTIAQEKCDCIEKITKRKTFTRDEIKTSEEKCDAQILAKYGKDLEADPELRAGLKALDSKVEASKKKVQEAYLNIPVEMSAYDLIMLKAEKEDFDTEDYNGRPVILDGWYEGRAREDESKIYLLGAKEKDGSYHLMEIAVGGKVSRPAIKAEGFNGAAVVSLKNKDLSMIKKRPSKISAWDGSKMYTDYLQKITVKGRIVKIVKEDRYNALLGKIGEYKIYIEDAEIVKAEDLRRK